jgi:hypothetical protein
MRIQSKLTCLALTMLLCVCCSSALAQFGGNQTSTGGTSTQPGGSALDNLGSVGQTDSSDRFLRQNRDAGDFVGGNADSMDGFVGAVQSGANARSGQTGIGQGGGRGNSFTGSRSSNTNTIRATLNVAFPVRTRSTATQAISLAGRMNRSSWIQNETPISVSIDNGVATLGGIVATDHDRVLAGRLARLEVGVRGVDNRLAVLSDPPVNPIQEETTLPIVE